MRRCARLSAGGWICGNFTAAEVDELESPHEQLQLSDALDDLDNVLALGAGVDRSHRPPP